MTGERFSTLTDAKGRPERISVTPTIYIKRRITGKDKTIPSSSIKTPQRIKIKLIPRRKGTMGRIKMFAKIPTTDTVPKLYTNTGIVKSWAEKLEARISRIKLSFFQSFKSHWKKRREKIIPITARKDN